MEKNIWSDFGFIITDGDDFENEYGAQKEASFDDIKNSDSPDDDQRKIDFYHFYLTSNPKNIFFYFPR